MKTYVLYCRTSSEDGDDGSSSIEDQETDMRAHVARANGRVKAVYADRDTSGRLYPADDPQASLDLVVQQYCDERRLAKGRRVRSGLANAIAALGEGDTLLVRELRRFARPLLHSMLPQSLTQALLRRRAMLESVVDGVQRPNDYMQAVFRSLDETLADKETSRRRTECKRALAGKRDAGLLSHSPYCYGYRSAGLQQVRAVSEEIDVVKSIYSAFLSGSTISAIVRDLNDSGVKTMRAGKPTSTSGKPASGFWSHKCVLTILRRPTYAGLQYDSAGALVKSRPFGIGAIAVADWRRVQAILDGRATGVRDHATIHPLSGLVYCGTCGRPLTTYQSNKGWGIKYGESILYYRCRSAHEVKECPVGCRMALSRADADRSRCGGLIQCLAPLAAGALAAAAMRKAEDSGSGERLAILRSEIDGLTAREQRAYEDGVEGVLDRRQLADAMARYRSRREEIEAAIRAVEGETSIQVSKPDGWAIAKSIADGTVPPLDLRVALRSVVGRVIVHADRLEVALKCGGTVSLPRVTDRNARLYPVGHLTIPKPATVDGHIRVTYFLPTNWSGDDDETVLWGDENLSVATVGRMPPEGMRASGGKDRRVRRK